MYAPESRCGIALAYCISHGHDSAEQFVSCVAKLGVVQHDLSYLKRGDDWDPMPIWTLNSHAASVLLQGWEKFGEGEQEDLHRELRTIKEDYQKPVRSPLVEIVYGEVPDHPGLWALQERQISDGSLTDIKQPFLKSRAPEVLEQLVADFVVVLDEQDNDDIEAPSTSGSERIMDPSGTVSALDPSSFHATVAAPSDGSGASLIVRPMTSTNSLV